jgi:hypothetical protein
MSYTYSCLGPSLCSAPIFNVLAVKNNTRNRRRYVPLLLLEQILAQWRHPVASSEALDLLHWAMYVVTYRRIVMAIKMASKVGVFFHRWLFACCPGCHWGDTEQVVNRWWHPGISSVLGFASLSDSTCIASTHQHGHRNGQRRRWFVSHCWFFVLT